MIIQSIVQSVFQPIARSVIDPIIISQGFSPKSLFTSGEQGAWYDPSDLSTMFQDAAGTTPVTSAGQPVGLMRDKSGRGNHASQATSASRPILRNSGALWWLEFDGVDDFLATASIDLTSTFRVAAFVGAKKNSDAATSIIVELSASATANNGAFYLAGPQGAGLHNYAAVLRGTTETGSALSTYTAPSTNILSVDFDISKATRLTEIVPRVDGLTPSRSNVGAADDAGTGNFGNYPLYICRRGGTTLPFGGNLYGLIVRGASTDVIGVAKAEKYMSAKSGVILK